MWRFEATEVDICVLLKTRVIVRTWISTGNCYGELWNASFVGRKRCAQGLCCWATGERTSESNCGVWHSWTLLLTHTASIFTSSSIWFALHTFAWQARGVRWRMTCRLLRLEGREAGLLWQGWGNEQEGRSRSGPETMRAPRVCVHRVDFRSDADHVFRTPLVWRGNHIECCDADPSHLAEKPSLSLNQGGPELFTSAIDTVSQRWTFWIPISCNN